MRVDLRIATEDDAHLVRVSNSLLVGINTCPTWGIIHGLMGKRWTEQTRSMPLEAGGACHKVFAAVRLYELRNKRHIFDHQGLKLFGETTFAEMVHGIDSPINFCLPALYNSGFYDDPKDRRRTMATLEECCIAYINKWEFGKWEVWVHDETKSDTPVGIETSFDLVIDYLDLGISVRYCGKIDGLCLDKNKRLIVHENKTASRLGDAWESSFLMSHQVTGYLLAAQFLSGQPCTNARIFGLSIPLPKTYDYGGVVDVPVTRDSQSFYHWFNWVHHTMAMYEQYKDDIINIPRYTHSCNRYFNSCSMIPYCGLATEDERNETLSSMITVDPLAYHNE